MKFKETKLSGSYIIDITPVEDERGFFARSWCADEFCNQGLKGEIAQMNIGSSRYRGTIRGLHFQLPPHAENKLIRCTRGAIHNVIIDLRPNSPTHRQWVAVELTDDNHKMVLSTIGFAQGYQTLTDGAEICYSTTHRYAPDFARGVRFNDPQFAIDWPLDVASISDADSAWADYIPFDELKIKPSRESQ